MHARSWPGGLTVLKRIRLDRTSAVSSCSSSASPMHRSVVAQPILLAMGSLFDLPEEPPAATDAPAPPAADQPLAARMRPRTLEQFVGQSHLLGPSSALRTAIQSGEPHSMILYGPPGTGKTTLARMLAEYSNAV